MFCASRLFVRMSGSLVPKVDIDCSGKFKYILIQLTVVEQTGEKANMQIVRGYGDCPFHTDINDRVCTVLEKLKAEGALKGWEIKVLGGGKMDHDASKKCIKVYGQSQGYGKANHGITAALLKAEYPDYVVTTSDE